MKRILLAVMLVSFAAGSARACGEAAPCQVELGQYMISMPDGAAAEHAVGAIVFFHGFRSSAEEMMNFKSLKDLAKALGVALIAPDGLNRSWSFPNAPRQNRDEMAFMNQVLDDALAKFPIDPAKLMSSGFSIGGSMSWYMACYLGERFAGHTPIAGTFWRPYPAECPGPDPFVSHVHGTADTTFPLAGRTIREKWHQGATGNVVAFFRKRGGYTPEITHYSDGNLVCEASPTKNGGEVELCLHDGGHSVRAEWVKRGWQRLAAFRGWKVTNTGG